MFWKLIIKLLKCKDKDYVKAVKVEAEGYIVTIEKFIPIEEEMKKWKDALEKVSEIERRCSSR